MKYFKLFFVTLSLLAGTASLYADIIDFGSTTQTEWTATSTDGCNNGSTITLDGVVVTFGSADNSEVTWSWHSGNAGLLPSQMPSTEGTAESLITSFSEEEPFGELPTHGAFFKIEPSKTGSITFLGKASANAVQPLIFVTCDKNDPTFILAAQITAWDNSVTQWTYEVDADHVYYFFQQSYPNKLTGYRFTFRGVAFEVDEVITGVKELAVPKGLNAVPYDLSGRPASGKSGIQIVNGKKIVVK